MIGKNIQKIRKEKGLTLSELATRANVSKSYLSNIERNLNQNPSIQIIGKIAGVLGVDLRTLLGPHSINQLFPEMEWLDFVNELKNSGVEKEQLQEFKTVIEFVKWQNENMDANKKK
ncbi:helix-turn-helix domain-containing protein [Virgibacillus necropolis]|uniref:helix-turn-helix domain-containing protein n=1 Tax=Virgibacillus necropolis TaxID=163877 RepID=UPI00384E47B2